MTRPAYLNIDEVAERLRVHSKTVRRLLKDGRLPGVRVGSQWRISVETLDQFMAGRLPADTARIPPAAEPALAEKPNVAVPSTPAPEPAKPKRKKLEPQQGKPRKRTGTGVGD